MISAIMFKKIILFANTGIKLIAVYTPRMLFKDVY